MSGALVPPPASAADEPAVVAGGGVTGLVAALTLASKGLRVTLLEASSDVGGKLTTTAWRGRHLDLGPDAFIVRNPAADELCRELGLGPELVAPASRQAAVFARGQLRGFPAGLVLGIPTDVRALARSGIVSPGGALRCALDLVLPGPGRAGLLESARVGSADPTIEEVVAPRVGRAVFSRLVDPLLGGINAGDSARLSFAASAPTLAELLGRDPSLMRSLRALAPRSIAASESRAARQPAPSGAGSGTAPAGADPAPIFLGLERGLSSLVRALAAACVERGVTIVTGTALRRVRRGENGGFELDCDGAPTLLTRRLVLATPAVATGKAVQELHPRLAAECRAIPYAGVVLVSMALAAEDVAAKASGNGVLVPREPGRALTALTFVSTKWPRHGITGDVIVRASLGHHGDDGVLDLDDASVEKLALAELRQVLSTAARPREVLVTRWPASFPQYVSGHLARVARIEQLATELPGLALAGAAYRGIGIPACVQDGRRAAELVAPTGREPAGAS